jgi:hypothetical protein
MSQVSCGAMVPVLPALSQVVADILFAAMPPTKQTFGWLTRIGIKKRPSKLLCLVYLSFSFSLGSFFEEFFCIFVDHC